jgi:hypothetical protein
MGKTTNEGDLLFDELVRKLESIAIPGGMPSLRMDRLATIFITARLAGIPAIREASAESKNEVAAGITAALSCRPVAPDSEVADLDLRSKPPAGANAPRLPPWICWTSFNRWV